VAEEITVVKWLNPFVWVSALSAYTKEHFVAWNLSSVMSWVQAWALSMAAPTWARELWTQLGPTVEEARVVCSSVVDVVREFFLNSS